MNQLDMKEQIEKMATQNYEFFIKALIDFELSIADSKKLDNLYQEYMGQDEMDLLNPYFRYNSECAEFVKINIQNKEVPSSF